MKQKIQIILGCAIGLFLLWYLFKDTDWPEVWQAFSTAHPGWLIMAMLVFLAGFMIRIWRWSYIVNPVVKVPFWRLFTATQIGFMGNFVLPARIGEVIRAVALSRSRNIPLPKTMAFVAVDRMTDLFGLVAVFIITLIVFRPVRDVYLPEDLRNLYDGPISQSMIRSAVYAMTVLLVAGTAVMMALFARKDFFLALSDAVLGRVSARLARLAHRLFEHFAEGMQVLTSARDLTKATSVSLLLWASFALAQLFMYRAFGLDMPWYTPFVVLSLLSVFISIPGPPGFIGPFHAGVVGGLILVAPDVNLNIARAVAIVAHLFNLLPIVIIGVICLSFERLDFLELSRKSEKIAEGEQPQDI